MRWLFAPRIRALVVWAALASFALNIASLMPAVYMLQVFDRVFSSRSIETLAMLAVLTVLALGLAWSMDRARLRLLARAGRRLDEALTGPALQSALMRQAHGQAQGDSLAVQDVARLRGFLSSSALVAMFDAPWMPLHMLLIACLHPWLGVGALVGAVLLLAWSRFGEWRLRREADAASRAAMQCARAADGLVRQAEALVSTGMARHALARWEREQQAALSAQHQVGDVAANMAAGGRTLRQFVQALLLTLGAWLVVAGHASPGIMVAATVLLGRALLPLEQLIASWRQWVEAREAWHRLESSTLDAAEAPPLRLPDPQGALQLERATLMPPQAGRDPLIKSISLALRPGECLGIVGPSGAGKSTLLRLMLGLRRPHVGSVRLDGAEMTAWPREQLDAAIGCLPQDAPLFAGSVAENIVRCGELDAAAVAKAAQRAGVHELILRLPEGYDTDLADAQTALSGGQRQRIALARAVYGSPRIVLLDEPDAHLDGDGEAALHETIASLKRDGASVVLVSHRPTLMRHVDRLAVLRAGALETIGPRDEVLARLAGRTVRALRPADAAVPATQAQEA